MFKHDRLVTQIYNVINGELFDYFIKEDFTPDKAEKHANDIAMQYAEIIAKKAVEICGDNV